jgi:hypothetical protein
MTSRCDANGTRGISFIAPGSANPAISGLYDLTLFLARQALKLLKPSRP